MTIKLNSFETCLVASAVVSDSLAKRWHPAIRHGLHIQYWPNITLATQKGAREWAEAAINDALEAANTVITGWNVISLT